MMTYSMIRRNGNSPKKNESLLIMCLLISLLLVNTATATATLGNTRYANKDNNDNNDNDTHDNINSTDDRKLSTRPIMLFEGYNEKDDNDPELRHHLRDLRSRQLKKKWKKITCVPFMIDFEYVSNPNDLSSVIDVPEEWECDMLDDENDDDVNFSTTYSVFIDSKNMTPEKLFEINNISSYRNLVTFPKARIVKNDDTGQDYLEIHGGKRFQGLEVIEYNVIDDYDDGSGDGGDGSSSSIEVRYRQRQRSLLTGTNKVLVVRVIDADGNEPEENQLELSQSIFGGEDDTVGLKTQLLECSGGLLNYIEGEPNNITKNTFGGVVDLYIPHKVSDYGPYTVNDKYDKDRRQLEQDVETELKTQYGYNIGSYRHTMIVLPDNTDFRTKNADGTINPGEVIAYGYVNARKSVYKGKFGSQVWVQAHEIGHNIGLGHSGIDKGSLYGDKTCLMGFFNGNDDAPRLCYNAAKSWFLEWYIDQDGHLKVPYDGVWTGNLISIPDYLDDDFEIKSDYHVLANIGDLYVAFNRIKPPTIGFRPEDNNKITVVRQSSLSMGTQSWKLGDSLGLGEKVEYGDYTVKVLAINLSPGTEHATVAVYNNTIGWSEPETRLIEIDPTPDPTPSPTPGPTPISTPGPTTPPTPSPTPSPTLDPTLPPTPAPTPDPTAPPTPSPTPSPSSTPGPTLPPTPSPTPSPTSAPTLPPTPAPTSSPTVPPTPAPTLPPTPAPTATPTASPTRPPTLDPTRSPSATPSMSPSTGPSESPSVSPSVSPSAAPSMSPSTGPSESPSVSPSASPSAAPSMSPSTGPSEFPSVSPSVSPSTAPSFSPSFMPSLDPSGAPSSIPSSVPSSEPSTAPSESSSDSPADSPSDSPSDAPTAMPSDLVIFEVFPNPTTETAKNAKYIKLFNPSYVFTLSLGEYQVYDSTSNRYIPLNASASLSPRGYFVLCRNKARFDESGTYGVCDQQGNFNLYDRYSTIILQRSNKVDGTEVEFYEDIDSVQIIDAGSNGDYFYTRTSTASDIKAECAGCWKWQHILSV